jgi:hypothetical protein
MAGTIIVSSIKTDTDNSFIVRSNTGATLFSVDTTSISIPDGSITSAMIANGTVIAADVADGSVTNAKLAGSITSDKITSVSNTAITGNIISSQITSVANTQLTGTITATQVGTTVSQLFGMRNRIINGAMEIDQRNAGASVTPITNQYLLDRYITQLSQASKFTVQQVSANANTAEGFQQSLRVTSSSAYSVLTGDFFTIQQRIEGYNIADLAWGTASAKTVTLSFWVYSSLTGTFGGAINNADNTRAYPFSYTISSANTWTKASITIPGDTSGTWLTTNGIGLNVYWGLGVGSTYSGTAGAWSGTTYLSSTGAVSVVGTSAATWYMTGAQLEIGSTATPFERRLYNQELAMCQRYYQRLGSDLLVPLYNESTTSGRAIIPYPVTMRAAPAALEQSGTASDYSVRTFSSGKNLTSVPSLDRGTTNNITVTCPVSGGVGASGGAGNLNCGTANGFLGWSAEL